MATYHYRGKCYHIYGTGDVAKSKIVGLLHGAAAGNKVIASGCTSVQPYRPLITL